MQVWSRANGLSPLTTDRFVSSLPGSILQFNISQFSIKVLPVDLPLGFSMSP
jgi:hypothetical protein